PAPIARSRAYFVAHLTGLAASSGPFTQRTLSFNQQRRTAPLPLAFCPVKPSAWGLLVVRRMTSGNGDGMEYFLQQLINGLTLGAIYGLIAIGYTMVYGIIGMINFAHGDIFMIGAFHAVIAFVILGFLGVTFVPLALVVVLLTATLLTSAYGWTVERVAYRPLRGSFKLAPLISAIGMSFVLSNFVQISQGARNKSLEPMIQGGIVVTQSPDGFDVQLSYLQMIIFVTTLVLMTGFTLLINRT